MKSFKDPYYNEEEAVAAVGNGWEGLVRQVYNARSGLQANVGIIRVGESPYLGGLRIGTEYIHSELEQVIQAAAKASYHICPVCGEPAGLRKLDSKYFVSCDAHGKGIKMIPKPYY